MISVYLFLLTNLFINKSYGFFMRTNLNIKNVKNDRKMSMALDPNINTIQEFKFYLDKENVVDFIRYINEEKFSHLYFSKDYTQVVGVDKTVTTNDIIDIYHLSVINPIEIPSIFNKAIEHNIPTNFIDFTSPSIANAGIILNNIFSIIGSFIPAVLAILFLRGLSTGFSQMTQMGPPNGPMNMIDRTKRIRDDAFITPNVSLNSWAGSPEVLEECREVVSYLDNRELFNKTGAEMPKGILLEGPPGTGKTLLAKGIATETNSSFITVSGSEFVELFVGMGAARVRELFKNAREKSPCVIFIDEIDAIGKQRGTGALMASNDEREQTLNQILFEMDGFNNNEGLLVLAATNRKDILDKALLRPGRFDRIIKVPLPDKYSREKILDYYCSSKQMEPNIDVKSLAEITDGFSGAELKNLLNEAAILTARQNKTIIGERELFNAFEKSIVGLVKNNNDASLTTKTRVAIHESGHALLALHFPEYFDLQKVSIQATYNGAGGYTIFTEKPEIKEGGLYTRDILKKRLIVTLGGKAAEYVYYGNDYVSLGAVQDLKQANQLAQKMVGNFGMGDKLEVFFNENINDDGGFFNTNKYSEYTKFNMDRETLNLINEAYNESKKILIEKNLQLVNMCDLLLNNTVLNKQDIQKFYL